MERLVKIVDNFLPKEEFLAIQQRMYSDSFPWYYNDRISSPKDPKEYFSFFHTFYANHEPRSKAFYLLGNLLNKINCKGIVRIKGNLQLGQSKKRQNKMHIDYKFKHKGCILYLNANNGETHFKTTKVMPKENRLVFFNPSEEHSSTVCSDAKRRVTIIFNYF